MVFAHRQLLVRSVSHSQLACFKPNAASIFTLTRKPLAHRRPDLGVVGDFEASHFERLLGNKRDFPKSVVTHPDELSPYNVDYTGQFRGASRLALRPISTEQVSDAMKLCNNWKLGVVPQGGNTSLVGTSTPVFDEVVISTRAMNKIISIDGDTGVVVCEAGVVPADLENVLAEPQYDLIPPIDLGSWDICNIGGNVATNARGIRNLRHPDFRYSVIGLEAVLSNGDVLNALEGSRKDLVGVDLKQCLIGTEGTFGIITKVAFRCPPRPKSTKVALLACENFESLNQLIQLARSELAETLSAFEYMSRMDIVVPREVCTCTQKSDHGAMNITTRQLNIQHPEPICFSGSGNSKLHAALVESSSCADDSRVHVLMNNFLQKARDRGICVAGVISESPEQTEKLWTFRKSIVDACKAVGAVFKFDLNISVTQLPELTRLLESVCLGEGLISCSADRMFQHTADSRSEPRIRDLIMFGQLPTGCIHVVATVDPETGNIPQDALFDVEMNRVPACVTRLESVLCNWLGMDSALSATSGGFLSMAKDFEGKQVRWVHRLHMDEYGATGSSGRELQLAIKRAWDPKGIMNPYKTWPFLSF